MSLILEEGQRTDNKRYGEYRAEQTAVAIFSKARTTGASILTGPVLVSYLTIKIYMIKDSASKKGN